MNDDDYLSDEYDPFETQSRQGTPSGPSRNWTLIIVLLGVAGMCMLLCCGGVVYLVSFGADILTEQIRTEIEENPIITEHIGNISVMSPEMAKSLAAEGDNVFVFRIEGDKGNGYLTVESITLDDGNQEVTGGTLKLDSGESFPLFDDEVLDANPDSTEGSATDDDAEPDSTDGSATGDDVEGTDE